MRALLLILACASSAGCLRTTEYKCTVNGDCTGGGTCEPNGYCSFDDPACADGRRYGEYSGPVANQCVGGMVIGDGGMPDGTGNDGNGNCPSTYAALPNAGAHVYKLTAGAAQWSTQSDRCMQEGAYLAIPDSDAELTAITTAAAAQRTWLGINDLTTEGTYVLVTGGAATFLPWNTATGEPDNPGNMGGEDCVAGLMATPTIATDRCSISYPAVCECDP